MKRKLARFILFGVIISIILIVILPASNYSEVLVIVTKWKFNRRNQWKRPDEGALHLSYSEILYRLSTVFLFSFFFLFTQLSVV